MSVNLLPETAFVRYFQTLARDAESGLETFVWAANRVNRILLEYALNFAHYEDRTVTTPIGAPFQGLAFGRDIHAVSIMRAGESFEVALRELLPQTHIGKILIQRDRSTLQPQFFYEKLPPGIENSTVLLLEPMLATGGSLNLSIQRLLNAGVSERQIICVHYLASPQGIEFISKAYPDCTLVVASVEERLTDQGYMLPGIGDFGDRYFE